ncbi:MAG: hypothetical protein RBR68_13860 [Tenuifilaceae bacterium]|jgi:hypothetical protein|nr:hypothetical protein [Tenuifilaceae bacterium]
MNEIKLNEKVQQKIVELAQQLTGIQEKLGSIVQTVVDFNGVEGKWDFPVVEGRVDITRLVKVEDETVQEGEIVEGE